MANNDIKKLYFWPKKLYQFITNLFSLANIPTPAQVKYQTYLEPPPPPPPPPPLRTFQNWVTWEVPKILIERGDNPETRGGSVDTEMGGCQFFITLQFNCIYFVGGWGGE